MHTIKSCILVIWKVYNIILGAICSHLLLRILLEKGESLCCLESVGT